MGLREKVFSSMAGGALMIPALLVLPAIFMVLLGVGWTREDIIEDSVYKLWASTGSENYKNKQYASDLGVRGFSTSFLAMAKSRDSGNIFSEERLREIRDRMEVVETVEVVHDNNTFTWKDICAQNNIGLGTVYEFPCIRLTPMDFFQEASWFVTEKDRLSWYDKGIKANIVTPRIARFGVMASQCSTTNGGSNPVCDNIMSLRLSSAYAEAMGYGADYANPLQLFSDLTRMEMNHPCRQCIESAIELVMEQLTTGAKGTFQYMYQQLTISRTSLSSSASPDEAKISKIDEMISTVGNIISKVDRAAIEEMFIYLTTRNLYAQLGTPAYLKGYLLVCSFAKCAAATGSPMHLLAHADSPFSSHNTAGSPFPLYSVDDAVGTLGKGNAPFGGSGLNLEGTPLSMTVYFGLTNKTSYKPLYTNGMADTTDAAWIGYVDSDPVYKWFMAGETKMTSHCGNEDLNIIQPYGSMLTTKGCTKYSEPLEDEERTIQHFAKMWYDLVIDSDSFLGITEGKSDPYSWTSGQGCPYSLKGSRDSYTSKNESEILNTVTQDLYYIDEGVSIGALDTALLIGESDDGTMATIQTIYPALQPKYIPDRVRNCNRPMGAINITEADAEVVLELFKHAMADAWTEGWDDNDEGEVQFVGFFDDSGVGGTFSFVLRDITNDNGKLTAISIIIIAVVSVIFLGRCDPIESRIMITLAGVLLVILSFFAALGFGILIGIKININIAWTLPFIIIGLGVDDMYIVLLALGEQKGYTKEKFVAAMKEIVIPVSMTSFVNASMFAIMNISDIGAVYKTAQAALLSVIFLYITIIFCFPAYCYLDMKRQHVGRRDVFICAKVTDNKNNNEGESLLFKLLYKKCYQPLVLGGGWFSIGAQALIVLSTLSLFGVGIYGVTQRSVGLGLKEFFPTSHQASRWAEIRKTDLASWSIGVSWGPLNYSDPDEQMRMIKQYEDIVRSSHVSQTGTDTEGLWIADFNLWTTNQCEDNFSKSNPEVKECGRDQIFPDDNTPCTGMWTNNTLLLREKIFASEDAECSPFKGGVCRPRSQMFKEDLKGSSVNDNSFCPVFEGSEAKFKFCLEKWRKHTGGGGSLLVEKDTATPYEDCAGEYYSDATLKFPIQYSASPSMYAINLNEHEDTLEMIDETREFCDYVDGGAHSCWMTGIPFDYWEQYINVESVLLTIVCASIAVGFVVATLFLGASLTFSRGGHSAGKIAVASLAGGTLITMTSILCVIPVIGISILWDVSLTAFSNMAFVLSIGFAVEYSVHVVHRFLSAPNSLESAHARVVYTMEFLFIPLTLSFLSSIIGIICLYFTEFEFNEVFFFRPLLIVMIVTYYIGTMFLPTLLTKLDFEFLRVGSNDARGDDSNVFDDDRK